MLECQFSGSNVGDVGLLNLSIAGDAVGCAHAALEPGQMFNCMLRKSLNASQLASSSFARLYHPVNVTARGMLRGLEQPPASTTFLQLSTVSGYEPPATSPSSPGPSPAGPAPLPWVAVNAVGGHIHSFIHCYTCHIASCVSLQEG